MKRVFAFLLLAALTGCVHVRSQPFTFVQMCDPQLGISVYEADLARFKQAIKQVNASGADFVVICGDLVHVTDRKSITDFKAAKAALSIPCYTAPGNHDVGNAPTVETLRQYRNSFGRDYFSFEHKGCTFVVVDTQLWKAPVRGATERQDAWLRKTLEKAAEAHRPIFVVGHIPLFEKELEEPEAYYNLPRDKRKELLPLFERCGVVAFLAGHTHKTIINEIHGIQMVTSGNTSANFDDKPFGFRIWRVGDARPYRHEFVPLEQP